MRLRARGRVGLVALASKAGREPRAHVKFKSVDMKDADAVGGSVPIKDHASGSGCGVPSRLKPQSGVEVAVVVPGQD